jgi:hypothetical protein
MIINNNIKNGVLFFNLYAVVFSTFALLQVQELQAETLIKSSLKTVDLSFKPAASSSEDSVLKMNAANISQLGLNNLASIDQNSTTGSNNDANIEQSIKSADNRALIFQTGNLNQAFIIQNGFSSVAYIYQAGHGNRALIRQN